MTTIPPQDWSEIRLSEVDPVAARDWIAVLPLAATEQHGPHLPFETDTMIGQAYLARVREIVPKNLPVTFLPIEPVGISTEHLAYPGTQTLATDVALKKWMALCDGIARIGVKKLVIITSHGGNSAAMALIAQDLRAKHDMLAVTTSWSRFGAPEGLFSAEELRFGIHGGAVETSIMLAAFPESVRKERIANFESTEKKMTTEFRWLSAGRPAPFAWAMQDLNPAGAVGDATAATAEKGKALIEHGARAFVELLTDVKTFDLARLTNQPQSRS
ncbi:creatininase family protein [Bradyrhizobium sp. G127]|uniref:creatininase family protein n=1 Tax=Bradyrhizobium sp. G127 TaxID=2904800 RepID=UPI001F28F077|nr:creatininase family protein [Bradyrhizobium sp. G127]MCF2521739.1 creatininase family protein [Bradyrhizobium sp. G127]